MAQVNHISRRRDLFNPGRRDVGIAWTGCCFYTAWLGHTGDRVSMGEKVAGNSPSVASRSISKNQVDKAELSRPSVPSKPDTRFCFKYFRALA
jgi:hypothetical protein